MFSFANHSPFLPAPQFAVDVHSCKMHAKKRVQLSVNIDKVLMSLLHDAVGALDRNSLVWGSTNSPHPYPMLILPLLQVSDDVTRSEHAGGRYFPLRATLFLSVCTAKALILASPVYFRSVKRCGCTTFQSVISGLPN